MPFFLFISLSIEELCLSTVVVYIFSLYVRAIDNLSTLCHFGAKLISLYFFAVFFG